MLKKRHALPLLTLLLCVVFVALMPVVALATAVADFSSFTYANYFTADYTVASTTGTASASGMTISLDATGVNATSGCNSTPAVKSTTTVTLTAKETVSVTCTPDSNVTLTPPSEVTSNSDGSKTFTVQTGQKVSFAVTASNATKVSGTVTFSNVEPTTSSVPEDCAAYSYNDKVYNYLDKVITDAAANGSGTIVVTASGKVYHSSVETDEDYASKSFTFTIPKGVTLLVPYSSSDTSVQSGLTSDADYLANGNYSFVAGGGQQKPNSSVTYALTIPTGYTLSVADGTAATVGNCGRIVVGGKVASGNGSTVFNGATSGEHSNLVIDGTLNLGNYAVLAVTGYVMGSGDIIAEGTGAQIYQPYVVMDFPGAAVAALAMRKGGISGAAQPSGETAVSPYIYWGVVNIQTDLKFKSGNFMYGYGTLGDDDNPYHTNAALVGNSSTPGLLVLDSDATYSSEFKPVTWSGYSYGLLGVNQIRIEGGASIDSLKLSLNAGWTSADIDTSAITLGLGYNMNITFAAGDDYYIDKSVMLLPGSVLTVADDATLAIGSNASSTIRFAVWDGLIHRGYRKSASSKGEYQVAPATTRYNNVDYPTNLELDMAGLSEDAEFVINGKLVIGAKTTIGGIIQSDVGGTVEVNAAATPSVKVQANILDCQSFNLNYRYMASMSMFDSAAKLNLNGELRDVQAGVTYIGIPNSELTNSGFTNTYYPGFDSSGNRVDASNLAITYNSVETIKGVWICETHSDEDSDHTCDVCGFVTECIDKIPADGEFADHICDICGNVMSECSDAEDDEDILCDICGKTLCAHDAEVTAVAEVPATCVADGTKAYWQCTACELYYADETCTTEIADLDAWLADETETGGKLAAIGHSYGEATYTWTDYSACVATRTCTVCTEETECHTETASATITSKVTKEATCSAAGEMTYTATFDKDWATTQTATEEIAADSNAHSWDNDCDTDCNNGCGTTREITHSYKSVVTAPTCTEKGYTTYTCACGISYTDNYVNALGHDEVSHEAQTATCTEIGWDAYVTCSRCDYTTYVEKAALGHDMVTDAAVAPTCTATGLTEGSHCSRCDDATTAQEVVPAKGHSMGDWIIDTAAGCETEGSKHKECANCDYTETEAIPATDHSYTSNVTTEPTCTTAGVRTYSCTCGESYTEEIEALGHNMVAAEGKAATCTEEGYTAYTDCSRCDYIEGKEVIPAVHTIAQGEAQTKTCTQDGWEAYEYCTECDYSTKVVIPAGHNIAQGEAQTRTCTQDGWEAYEYCTECDYTTKVVIPAGHTIEQGAAQTKTCTQDGWEAYEYCTECDYTTKVVIPATGHTEGEAVEDNRKEPTATQDGSYDSVVYCTVCGTELSRDTVVLPATGVEDTTIDIEVELVGVSKNNFGATVTAPYDGWKEGTNTFTVSCDKACVVVVSYDNGVTYEALDATFVSEVVVDEKTTIGTYSFTADNMTEKTLVKVMLKGDINADGKVNNADVARLRAGTLSKVTIDELQIMCCDINGDDKVNSADVARLQASTLSKVTLEW